MELKKEDYEIMKIAGDFRVFLNKHIYPYMINTLMNTIRSDSYSIELIDNGFKIKVKKSKLSSYKHEIKKRFEMFLKYNIEYIRLELSNNKNKYQYINLKYIYSNLNKIIPLLYDNIVLNNNVININL